MKLNSHFLFPFFVLLHYSSPSVLASKFKDNLNQSSIFEHQLYLESRAIRKDKYVMIQEMFKNYSIIVKPRLNMSEMVTVYLDLKLTQLVKVDIDLHQVSLTFNFGGMVLGNGTGICFLVSAQRWLTLWLLTNIPRS